MRTNGMSCSNLIRTKTLVITTEGREFIDVGTEETDRLPLHPPRSKNNNGKLRALTIVFLYIALLPFQGKLCFNPVRRNPGSLPPPFPSLIILTTELSYLTILPTHSFTSWERDLNSGNIISLGLLILRVLFTQSHPAYSWSCFVSRSPFPKTSFVNCKCYPGLPFPNHSTASLETYNAGISPPPKFTLRACRHPSFLVFFLTGKRI